MKQIALSSLQKKDLAGVVVIDAADELLMISAVRCVELLLGASTPLKKLQASELAQMGSGALQSLSPNGLFGSSEVFVIERVSGLHKAKLKDWVLTLINESVSLSLVLTTVGAKAPIKLPDPIDQHAIHLKVQKPTAPRAAIECLLQHYGVDLPHRLASEIERLLNEFTLIEIERALELFLLSIDGAYQNAELSSFLIARETDIINDLLAGDSASLLKNFQDEVRSSADLSTVMSRTPFALSRSARNSDYFKSIREIHFCEAAQRGQAPLAMNLAERSLLRIARRIRAQRRS